MALPEQIRKQTEAVQDLYKQLNPETENDKQNAEAAKDEQVDNSIKEEAQDAQGTTADTETKNAKSSDGNEHSSSDNQDNFAQKYKTLQGMYNAEVPKLHATNRELQARLAQMENLLSTLSTQPTVAPQTIQATPLISDKDREEYGESLDVMRKVSKEELTPVTSRIMALENAINHISSSLNTNILPQVSRVAQQQALSQEDKFWGDLASRVPQWQNVNNDPEFQSWLLEIDPMTGNNRQTYLEQAQANLDANRVAAFFNTWIGETGKHATNANVQPTRSSAASELEKQVAPGRSRSSGAPNGQQSRNYTRDDINAFFADVRQGKYKGREAERDRIERDIFSAQREGRIVVNV